MLDSPCPECGFVAGDVDPGDLGRRFRENADGWPAVLAAPDAGRRPSDGVWSPVEYACHVRDVHRVFAARLRLMLEQDDPAFDNWDQDATAVDERYDLADPADVGPALVVAAGEVAALYDAVPVTDRGRTGRRSNGSAFTVTSLGRYHLHDVVHHLRDVLGERSLPSSS